MLVVIIVRVVIVVHVVQIQCIAIVVVLFVLGPRSAVVRRGPRGVRSAPGPRSSGALLPRPPPLVRMHASPRRLPPKDFVDSNRFWICFYQNFKQLPNITKR